MHRWTSVCRGCGKRVNDKTDLPEGWAHSYDGKFCSKCWRKIRCRS